MPMPEESTEATAHGEYEHTAHRVDVYAKDKEKARRAFNDAIGDAASEIDGQIIYQAELEPEFVVYRCSECGKKSESIGRLHAHIERHRGLFGFQLPWRYGDFDELMEMTEVIEVTEYDYGSEEAIDA